MSTNIAEALQLQADLLWDINRLVNHAILDMNVLPINSDEMISHLQEASRSIKHVQNLFEIEQFNLHLR